MSQYGLLIDNEYCTGCRSCEIACQNELGLEEGQWGVKVLEMGPWPLPGGKRWEYRFVPVLSSSCTLCADRIRGGGRPACAKHCLADAIQYGELGDLASAMSEKGKMASIFIP